MIPRLIGEAMIERVTETREIVFDLYLWFFSGKQEELQDVQKRLTFKLDSTLSCPSPTTDTFSVDFSSDYADDKPGWVSRLSDIPDGETLWTFGGEKTWQVSRDVRTEYDDNLDLTEWLLFSRVVADVEVTYEWDFEDEDAMEGFTDLIGKPIFESMMLFPGSLQVTEYVMQLYDC